jgi:hypothetical protein
MNAHPYRYALLPTKAAHCLMLPGPIIRSTQELSLPIGFHKELRHPPMVEILMRETSG